MFSENQKLFLTGSTGFTGSVFAEASPDRLKTYFAWPDVRQNVAIGFAKNNR
jgi:hypothetical protein